MSYQYDEYLKRHKAGVEAAYMWLCDNTGECNLNTGNLIRVHDASKTDAEEYNAYDAYFYGNNRSHKVMEDFNRAWLHHIHHNPHHWQYWVLLEDDPSTGKDYICLDMPIDYIIEMICDWWSFSFANGDLYEIFNWYDTHKKTMKLSSNTRKTVERYLDTIKTTLDERKSGNITVIYN